MPPPPHEGGGLLLPAPRGKFQDHTFFLSVALLDAGMRAAERGGGGGGGGGGDAPLLLAHALGSPRGALEVAAAAQWVAEKGEERQGGHRTLDEVALQVVQEVGWEWGRAPEGVLPLAARLPLAALGAEGARGGAPGRGRLRTLLRERLLALEMAMLDAAGWRLFAPTPDAFLPVLLLRESARSGGVRLLEAGADPLLAIAGVKQQPGAVGRAQQLGVHHAPVPSVLRAVPKRHPAHGKGAKGGGRSCVHDLGLEQPHAVKIQVAWKHAGNHVVCAVIAQHHLGAPHGGVGQPEARVHAEHGVIVDLGAGGAHKAGQAYAGGGHTGARAAAFKGGRAGKRGEGEEEGK